MINWTTEDIGANYYGRVAREFGYVMLITSNDNNANRKTRLQLAIYSNEQDFRARWALWTGYEDTLADCQRVAANFLQCYMKQG